MIRDLDRTKRSRKKHNYTRDAVLVFIALAVVIFYFGTDSRFSLNPQHTKTKSTIESHEKIVYAGPILPEDLKLTAKKLAPVDRYVKKNAKHFKQIRVHIERQDSYGGVSDDMELRFFVETTYNDGAKVKSVYTPCTLKQLPNRIVRRLRDDMTNYFSTKKKIRGTGTDIKEFTNTM